MARHAGEVSVEDGEREDKLEAQGESAETAQHSETMRRDVGMRGGSR